MQRACMCGCLRHVHSSGGHLHKSAQRRQHDATQRCNRYEGFLEVIARLALKLARKDAAQIAPTSKQVVAEKRAAYNQTNYTDGALKAMYDSLGEDLFDEI